MRDGRAAGPGRTPPSPAATNWVNHKAVGVRCWTARWWLGTVPESRRPEGEQRATVCRRLGCGKAEPMQAPRPWTEARVRAGAAGTCRAAYRTAGLLARRPGEEPPERRTEPVKPLTDHSDEGTQAPPQGLAKSSYRQRQALPPPEQTRRASTEAPARCPGSRVRSRAVAARRKVSPELPSLGLTQPPRALLSQPQSSRRPERHGTLQGRVNSRSSGHTCRHPSDTRAHPRTRTGTQSSNERYHNREKREPEQQT